MERDFSRPTDFTVSHLLVGKHLILQLLTCLVEKRLILQLLACWWRNTWCCRSLRIYSIHYFDRKVKIFSKKVKNFLSDRCPFWYSFDALDAFLMLYQPETVSRIGQSGIMMLLCPPKILQTTRQNLQSGLKSTEKQPKREKTKPFGFGFGRGRRIRTRDPRFWSGSKMRKSLANPCFFACFNTFFLQNRVLQLCLKNLDALLMLWKNTPFIIGYMSIAASSKRNFSMPTYRTPFSSCHGMMLSLTTTIFLKESGILAYGRTSWSLFSSSPTVSVDWI